MGFFSKNKDENDKAEVKNASYEIVLKEKLGSTTRNVRKPFMAERWIDEDDHVVYLRNVKLNFFEIFPDDMQDFTSYTEDEVDKRLTVVKKQLKNEREQDNPEINDRNLEFEILKLQAKRRSFKFSKNSAYLTFGTNGQPQFYFMRQGSTVHPFKWDVDTSTVYTPSDNKKKKAAISLRNKQNKYRKEQFVQVSTIILLIVAVALIGINLWGSYKLWSAYDDSEIAAIKRACMDDLLVASNQIEQSAANVNAITKLIKQDLNKPQTVISGVQPR